MESVPAEFPPEETERWFKVARRAGEADAFFAHPSMSPDHLGDSWMYLSPSRNKDAEDAHEHLAKHPGLVGWMFEPDDQTRSYWVPRLLAGSQAKAVQRRLEVVLPGPGEEIHAHLRFFCELVPAARDKKPMEVWSRERYEELAAGPASPFRGWWHFDLFLERLRYRELVPALFDPSLGRLMDDAMLGASLLTGAARRLLRRELEGLENPWKGTGL